MYICYYFSQVISYFSPITRNNTLKMIKRRRARRVGQEGRSKRTTTNGQKGRSRRATKKIIERKIRT